MIGTSADFKSGEKVEFWDLLHALMLPSGNDAAYAIAEYIGKLIFFEDPFYKEKLAEDPTIINNIKHKDAIKYFI